MKLYNSITKQKEEFKPIAGDKVTIYSCGPTVYNYFHIGNARPFIVFDVLRRYLEYRGYNVVFVQNFTDIDDKVIARANELGLDYLEIANRYIDEYYKDAKGLGIRKASIHPRATENIDAIIELVEKLFETGYAYEVNGDVYFRALKFTDYGKLSKQPIEDLVSGARIEVDERKEHPIDFALWKAAKLGEPAWDSPWGRGRPGWHIECSAMANRYLGPTIDIHSGGVDLKFPHHENEIAQSEAANGCRFANFWLHNAFLNIDNQKMSKSLGNFLTVREIAEKYGYEPIRFFMLSAHYRSPLNYSVDSMTQASAALERLYTAKRNLEFIAENGERGELDGNDNSVLSGLDKNREAFIGAMDDDLNTADAVAAIFELVRDINILVNNTPKVEFAKACLERLYELADVLGLMRRDDEDELSAEIEALIEKRSLARKNRDFAEADRIRDELKSRGIVLEDTPQGVKWHRI
ncbi:MAG: cysteine--tRNA ligase [Clostridiales bacterium]|nr:cysteine--tRNA ligase [Clostridiales bacterium]